MEPTKSSEMIIDDSHGITFGRKSSKVGIVTLVMLAVGIMFFIAGIAMIAVAAGNKATTSVPPTTLRVQLSTVAPTTTTGPPSRCDFSEEAKRVGLDEFLNRVKATYYKLHPYEIHFDPDASTERIKVEYVPYDPTPSVIKNRTDTSLALFKEINETIITTEALKHRERKALAKVKHFLQHVFGQPYDVNYYAGDWMLGPNKRCIQQICDLGKAVYNGLGVHHKPNNASDVELIETKLKTYNTSILQYMENMKMGVHKGMVRTVEECKAGSKTINTRYLNVFLNGSRGVLKEWFVQPLLDPDFYSNITEEIDNKGRTKHSRNVSQTIKDYLVTYLGEPLDRLLRYIKEEHIRYCVPSNVSSGWANLPLKYVWFDGKENKTWPTDPYLPTGEPLNGSWAYSQILSYFTTNAMTPMEVQELGKEQLKIIYPMVVEVAKIVTGENDNETAAISKFRKKLGNSSEIYFNSEPFPEIESNEAAHKKCSKIEGIKKYCPKRWAALQLWMAEARKVMSLLAPKTINMFHFTGDKATTPTCPIEMHLNLNPASSVQSYEKSDADCTKTAKYKLPFFKTNYGPKYEEWSVNVYMARPGRHTQTQGYIEHFRDSCGGVIAWLDSVTHYAAINVGWAYYAEYQLIGNDTDTYDNEPMQKYGMLKWRVIAALRLIIDPGLHYIGNVTRDTVLEYLSKYAWEDTDMAQSEATRYQSLPGHSTAYMIGRLEIMRLRQYCKDELGDKFSLRDFHYQILSQGTCPLAYLDDHVKRYVACVKNAANEGCDVILNPPKKTEA